MNEGRTIKEQIAGLLQHESDKVVIKFVRKLKEDPEYDPILALASIAPFLEQDEELLAKVERLVYDGIRSEGTSEGTQGKFHIIMTEEIVPNKLSDNSMIRRAGRFNKKISDFIN